MVAIAAVLSGSMLKRWLTEPARLFRFVGSNDIDCGRNRVPRFAWYGHLKFKESWLPLAIVVNWGIALFEYWLAVPANRWGSAVYGGDHADRVRRVLRPVPEGAAGLESRTGVCADRRRRVFYFS